MKTGKGKVITIKCTNEQGLNIYEKKCINGHECQYEEKCEDCSYSVENIEFDIIVNGKK